MEGPKYQLSEIHWASITQNHGNQCGAVNRIDRILQLSQINTDSTSTADNEVTSTHLPEEDDLNTGSHTVVCNVGVASASAIALLQFVYLGVLWMGFNALTDAGQPIPDPYFAIMEVLILLMVPPMTTLMIAVHLWSQPEARVYGMAALVFMSITAGLTSAVHFSVLVLSRHEAFLHQPLLLSFTWPSVVYVLDILAWDVFFSLSVVFSAFVFRGPGLARWVRSLLIVSGITAFAGLGGVLTGDMRIRNIGIVGYAIVFPVAALIMALLFHRSQGSSVGNNTG